jgi:hypothetical protein
MQRTSGIWGLGPTIKGAVALGPRWRFAYSDSVRFEVAVRCEAPTAPRRWAVLGA